MSTTPGKPSKARQSTIPTPGKSSGIPTPGRSRSTSSATQHGGLTADTDYMSRAFADAIKSNDPAQHRPSRPSDVSSASLSPRTAETYVQSGRRSVAGRPSSVASSSSAVSIMQTKAPLDRSKTPSGRPSSRQSDLFGRSVSRVGKTFDPGDSVRIESLGYEGTLRYIGEIDGKQGLWAGVELSGGFAGKGKNDGLVNGKQYFTCPPKCGVFVATTKLSLPTVGPGAAHRPSSVASSRGAGHVTPSFSGRITPSASTSISSGRVTPSSSTSNGRRTPSFAGRVTPSTRRITPAVTPSRARSRSAARSAGPSVVIPPKGNAGSSSLKKITAGSRASKYVGMTARELSYRDSDGYKLSHNENGSTSPPRSMYSPTQAFLSAASPTRLPGSPLTTPRPGPSGRISNIGVGTPSSTPSKGRPSYNTPRARIPSAVAMPPPASPAASGATRSISLNDPAVRVTKTPNMDSDPSASDLELSGSDLQDKIAKLMSRSSSPSRAVVSPRPESAASTRSASEPQPLIGELQSRLDALEYENRRLRIAADTPDPDHIAAINRIDALQNERDAATSHISHLKAQIKTAERSLNERDSKIDSLDRALQQLTAELEQRKSEGDNRSKDLRSKLDDSAALIETLKEAIEAKEGLENQNGAILNAKNAEIALLQARVDKAYTELTEERKELGAQVDELRLAGQETIALYEDRLSAADTKRYELEDRIAVLENRVRKDGRSTSDDGLSRLASSAAQIDNETLRDQVQHLQKKVSVLEDNLEDVRATSEREEAAVRERIKRFKEKDEAMKKELNDGRKEVEQMVKSEANARGRVEEIEEALRESTFALENSRAEIEGLRAELADLGGSDAKGTSGNASERVAEASQRAANERNRFTEEIIKLKELLEESRASRRQAIDEIELSQRRAEDTSKALDDLKQFVETLEFEKNRSDHVNAERLAKLESERQVVSGLHRALDERSAEVESLKKRINRDIPLNINSGLQDSLKSSGAGAPQSPSSSKYDLPVAREEITGLKHIVQELQKENLAATQRNKLLESENRLLLSETDQLRQDLKILEDNIEQTIIDEERALSSQDDESMHISGNGNALQMTEQKAKLEVENEQLRKRLAEAEMKNARTVHDLNKEINELEALVESKIYREDELEQELERAKDRLARSQKKTSKNSLENNETRHRVTSASSEDSLSSSDSPPQGVCEICERPGHDIFNCDLLRDDAVAIPKSNKPSNDPSSLFCEDCESHGHLAVDCPHSLDVF